MTTPSDDPGHAPGHAPDRLFGRAFDRTGTGSSKWARTVGAAGVIAMGLADMDLPGPCGRRGGAGRGARGTRRTGTRCATRPAGNWWPAGTGTGTGWRSTRRGYCCCRSDRAPPSGCCWRRCDRPGRCCSRRRSGAASPRSAGPPEWPIGSCRWPGTPCGYRLPLEAFAGHRAGAVLLSSPHNPSGRVWTAEEVRALAEAAARGGGVLLSDEVHGDLTHPGHRHPVAVAVAGPYRDRTVTLNSVGKTFNTSGIPSCFALVPDAALRERLTGVMAGYGLWEGGLLEQVVQEAALRDGGPWLDALLDHLAAARDRLTGALGEAVRSAPEASYLLWLDAAALGLPPVGARAALLERCGLEASDGGDFGPGGEGSLRLNYALPEPALAAAVGRLERLRNPGITRLHRL